MKDVQLLLVDDDELIHKMVPRALEEVFGPALVITHARTPQEALTLLESLQARTLVVLSDYDLKADLNGVQLLERVAEVRPETIRLLFSGHPRERLQQHIEHAPIHAFFEKPMRLQELVQPLAAVLGVGGSPPA